jgi:Kef-type K+ transport system membrane component KefB
LAIAFVSPLLAHLLRRFRIPGLVFEIALGIVVGPAVLNLVEISEPIRLLSTLGLATLIFLAGLEIDPKRIAGRPLRLALVGWAISILLGFLITLALTALGVIKTELFVTFALTSTALGALLPILRDRGLLGTRFGTHVLAIGSVGEFGPIIAVALVLSGASPTRASLALLGFAVVAIGALVLVARLRLPLLRTLLGASMRSSGQLYVRLAVLLVAAFTVFAVEVGLDFLLGAFTAGALFRLFLDVTANEDERDVVEAKIEAVSYGYLVPVFFVVTGVTFDLDSLLTPVALLKLPLFLLLFLVVRGVPVLLYRREDRRDRWALAFLSATALPLVVAITTIGVERNLMLASTAAALVGAGMLSVVLGPLIGLRFAPPAESTDPVQASDS